MLPPVPPPLIASVSTLQPPRMLCTAFPQDKAPTTTHRLHRHGKPHPQHVSQRWNNERA